MYPVIQITTLGTRSIVAYFATRDEAIRYAASSAHRLDFPDYAYEAPDTNVSQPLATLTDDTERQLQNAVLAHMNHTESDASTVLKAVLEFLHYDIDEDGSYMLAFDGGPDHNETLYVTLSEEI